MQWLQGKKTYIIAALSIAGSLGAYFQGSVDLQGLISAVQTALLAASIRGGVSQLNK